MIIEALIGLLNGILDALGKVASFIVLLLPDSPFLLIENIQIPFINQLNWILPIDFMLTVSAYWLSAILIYYVVQTVLRWVKMIE